MSLNITDAIFARAQQEPDSIAVIDDERAINYRTLCYGVCRAAHRFRQAGWQAGDIVGISLRNTPALHLVTSLALARMGVTQASLPASDPAPLRLSRIKRLGVSGVVIDEDLVTTGINVAAIEAKSGWLAESSRSVAPDDIRADGGDRLWIITETSGTTAEPKLIGISHTLEDTHGIRQASVFAYQPGERFLNLTDIQFLTGIARAIRCLINGGTLAFPPAGLDTDQLFRWIELHHVTYISCVPMHLHQLLRGVHTDTLRLPSLRILRSGTAALPPTTLKLVHRSISSNVYVSYGSNEVSTIVAATPEMLAEHPDTVGRPLAGVELEIVDDQDRQLPPGATGHVRVRGLGIQPTYLQANGHEKSRVFRDGWYYPGDIGVKNEAGLVFIKGRADDVMNFDGIMIGPGEIESVLRQHPAVADAAAFAVPSFEHQDIPAAAVVFSHAMRFDELGRFCTERLGIRAPLVFLKVDEIPRNAMGKILRRRLTELALQKLQRQSRS